MQNNILSRYIVKEEIGHGSFGKILKASDMKNSGHTVAIKIVFFIFINNIA